MSKTVVEILTEARELISDPKRWTQNTYARYKSGVYVPSSQVHFDSNAHCFCAVGALSRAMGVRPGDVEASADSGWRYLAEEMKQAVHTFNDSHTHAEVLAAFDRAIERAKACQIQPYRTF